MTRRRVTDYLKSIGYLIFALAVGVGLVLLSHFVLLLMLPIAIVLGVFGFLAACAWYTMEICKPKKKKAKVDYYEANIYIRPEEDSTNE